MQSLNIWKYKMNIKDFFSKNLFILLFAGAAFQINSLLVSCNVHKIEVKKSSRNFNTMEKIKNTSGIVGFWEEVNSFTITVSQVGTYDSQILFVVDNMPVDFKISGLKVQFSGSFENNPELPPPSLGGQVIYQLYLDKIKLTEND